MYASLTGLIDITAHNLNLFQNDADPKNINDIFIPKNDISVAEPYDVVIDEFGNTVQMYQFTGDINDTKVAGLESLLNYINENFFNKDEQQVYGRQYNITKKQYINDINNIYNIDKSKSYKIHNHNFNDAHYYNKQQSITQHLTNYISKKNFINNNENVLNVKKDFSTKNYITNVFRHNNDYIENNLYKKYDNRTVNNTNNITKHINNHSNDVTNNYRINKINNVKKSYFNFNDDITLNKTSTTYSNDTYNITKNNKLFNINDKNYYTKKINNTSNITNNITRHIHDNHEHIVTKKIHNHIKHINNYDTEINYSYYNKKSFNKKNYYSFYNDIFNIRKIENISLAQQADIKAYVGTNYINNDKIATIVVNPIPSLNDNYVWTPSVSDDYVPGLDSLLTYLNQKFASINTLQNSITNITNTINNEIQNLQTSGGGSKNLSYHTNHTDYLYQKNITNNDKRQYIVHQNNYFTFQRQYNTHNLELMIQMMQLQIEQMQAQINNMSSGSSGEPSGGGDIGTM